MVLEIIFLGVLQHELIAMKETVTLSTHVLGDVECWFID